MRLHLDPRCKLYLLIIGNLLLFFHVNLHTEMLLMVLFLFPFYLTPQWKKGLRLTILYVLLLLADTYLVPAAKGLALSWISLLAVGIRMILPCITTGAYAFTTTGIGEFVCALRKMKVPEAVIIPYMVVLRFFPTVREDYRQIRNAMALRGIGGDFVTTVCHPMQTLEYVLIPLLMNSNNVSGDLSIAALTKGIGCQGEHTSLIEIHFSIIDLIYMIICTIPLIMYIAGIRI